MILILYNYWEELNRQIKAKAIEHHEKFFYLCKYSDLGIHEIEAARKRLAGLKKS